MPPVFVRIQLFNLDDIVHLTNFWAKAAQAGPQPGAQGPFNGQAGPQGADDQSVDEQ